MSKVRNAECGMVNQMRNAECGIDRATVEPRSEFPRSTSALQFRIPHSALRIRGGGAV